MKKTAAILIVLALLSVQALSATDLAIEIENEKEIYLPNESIEFDVSVENLDSAAIEDAELNVNIGERTRKFNLGDLEPGEELKENIEIDELPGGTSYQIEAEIEYTGFLGETYTETTRDGFRVEFPDFLRIPRHIFIGPIEIPEETLEGEQNEITSQVTHDGDVESDLKLVLQSTGDRSETEIDLNPGESVEETLNKTFSTPGTGFVEARVYAYSEEDEFILDYLDRQIYVESQRHAELEVETNLEEEGSTGILEFDIKNVGDDAAHQIEIRAEADTSELQIEEITTSKQEVLTPNEETTKTYNLRSSTNEEITSNIQAFISYADREEREIDMQQEVSLEGSAARIEVEDHSVEKDERNSIIGLKLSNTGDTAAKEVQLELKDTDDLNVITSSEGIDDIPAASTIQTDSELEFRTSSSSLETLQIPVKIEYLDTEGEHSTTYTAELEGGQEQGGSCSFDWQCSNSEGPLYCSENVESQNTQQSCCPAGTSWDGESCISSPEFIVTSKGVDAAEEEIIDTTEKAFKEFAEVTYFQELDSPIEHIDIHYLSEEEIGLSETNDCSLIIRDAESSVLESRYGGTFDGVAVWTDNDLQLRGNNIGGCGTIGRFRSASVYPNTNTFVHELGHNFGLGHTTDYENMFGGGCGATRSNPDSIYANDRQSDGVGEYMNYCSERSYFSNNYRPEDGKMTEYEIIKQVILQNNWM